MSLSSRHDNDRPILQLVPIRPEPRNAEEAKNSLLQPLPQVSLLLLPRYYNTVSDALRTYCSQDSPITNGSRLLVDPALRRSSVCVESVSNERRRARPTRGLAAVAGLPGAGAMRRKNSEAGVFLARRGND